MTPRQDIRFCTTADGVRLAMALYGEGPPLVKAATWLTHIEAEHTSDYTRQWVEELARSHRYVAYDARGCGLSSRHVDEISFEAWLRDLETVVDALGLETFPLLGISQGAAIAVAYAARHPERVSRLVLFGGFPVSYFSASRSDTRLREEGETLIKLAELGWGQGSPAFRQVFVSKFFPAGSRELQKAFDEYQHATTDPPTAARCLRAMFSIDVREQAKQVRCPTLVMHMRGDQVAYFDQGRKLASLIPGARFLPLEGDNHVPLPGDAAWPPAVAAIREFLGTGTAEAPRLTGRQLQVLRLVAAGCTDKEVARQLQLSPRTVEMHMAAALKALDCGTRAEAVHRATGAGLLR